MEYRRVGQNGGGYPGTLDDVRTGAKYVAKIPGLDLSRVVLAGHSAGGQLALWLAAQDEIELREVIALAAVSDLRRGRTMNLGDGAVAAFLGGGDHDSLASPIELLPMRVPQRLLHGTFNDVVSIELSERFASASQNAIFVPLPNAAHLEAIDPRSKEWPTVLHHIREPMLKKPTAGTECLRSASLNSAISLRYYRPASREFSVCIHVLSSASSGCPTRSLRCAEAGTFPLLSRGSPASVA